MKIAATLFALCTIATSIAWFKMRETTEELRSELQTQRDRAGDINRLRADHAKLVGTAISGDELQALRNDHAAVVELRSELAALQRNSRITAP